MINHLIIFSLNRQAYPQLLKIYILPSANAPILVFKNIITFVPCCSHVDSTLQNRSSHRFPLSLRVPCVTLRSITTRHIDCSQGLFVAATSFSKIPKYSASYSISRFDKAFTVLSFGTLERAAFNINS